LNYAAAFPEEIKTANNDYDSSSLKNLKRQLPEVEVFEAGRKNSRSGR